MLPELHGTPRTAIDHGILVAPELAGDTQMTDELSNSRSVANPVEAEAMARYGIVLVPVDYFHYGKFRYTNLKDAIAQAKRDHPSD